MQDPPPTFPTREKLPRHVAIIMDGNGRWARGKGLSRLAGHRQGMDSVRAVVEACREWGIGYLTLFAFSEENWGRPRPEVTALMALLRIYLRSEIRLMKDQGIRLRALGNITRLPKAAQRLLREAMDETAGGQGMVLSLALSYGGRDEIIRAARRLAAECLAGRLRPEDIDQADLARGLDTADMPDPDLLIRTSGERRVSDFMLWQMAYSEIYITDTYWPDFRKPQLAAALEDYSRRERRFGLTGEQVRGETSGC
ncbi:MAG: isoprenyl transferase [Pseudomonadota bacterium]